MDSHDEAILRAAVDFVQNAIGGYGGNAWRSTHAGRELLQAVESSGRAVCAECETLLAKDEVRQSGGSDPFCADCWAKIHPESDDEP